MDDSDHEWGLSDGASPTDRARACSDLCVFELMFPRSGFRVDTRRFIERTQLRGLVRLRHILRQGIHVEKRPRVVCALCGDGLNLAARAVPAGGHAYYFSHLRDAAGDKAACPYRSERPDQSEIEAWKYHGQRESDAHRDIKARIARCLSIQPGMQDIVQEQVWIGPRGWRKPDVSATWLREVGASIRLAFEAQLSTTFISTIIKRREFYRSEGALLVWVLRNFDPADRRMTTEDILFSNNSNVLVVNKLTEAMSEASGRFMIEVHWHEPALKGRQICGVWKSAIVAFDELTVDLARQQCFFFDVAARESELRREAAARAAEDDARRRQQEMASISERFVAIVLDTPLLPRIPENLEDLPTYPDSKEWYELRRRFAALGAELPYHPTEDWKLVMIVRAIMSAKLGRPVGWDYKKLIEVAHLLAGQHKYALKPFARPFGPMGESPSSRPKIAKGNGRSLRLSSGARSKPVTRSIRRRHDGMPL